MQLYQHFYWIRDGWNLESDCNQWSSSYFLIPVQMFFSWKFEHCVLWSSSNNDENILLITPGTTECGGVGVGGCPVQCPALFGLRRGWHWHCSLRPPQSLFSQPPVSVHVMFQDKTGREEDLEIFSLERFYSANNNTACHFHINCTILTEQQYHNTFLYWFMYSLTFPSFPSENSEFIQYGSIHDLI